MAFTAYIFDEDCRRLISDFKYSSEGGSLYGQWTSTGNPVIHVAFGYSLPKQTRMTDHLSEGYKLCHIGEWRPYRSGNVNVPREDLLLKYRGRGTRFVVVDVAQDMIKPNLYEKPHHEQQFRLKGQGNLERLSGENPFNLVLRNPQAALRHDSPPYHKSAMTGQGQRSPGHARSQSQEIEIKDHQWYSRDRGNENMKKVFLKFQDHVAASGTKVDMSRDTNTHDMSMAFTDKLYNKWEVKFPYDFPVGGATLINKSQPVPNYGGAHRPTSYDYGAGLGTAEQQVAGSTSLDTAVANIISQMRSKRF